MVLNIEVGILQTLDSSLNCSNNQFLNKFCKKKMNKTVVLLTKYLWLSTNIQFMYEFLL